MAAVAVAWASLGSGATAFAQTADSERARAREISAELHALETELGDLAEQYNVAQIQQTTANQRLNEVREAQRKNAALLTAARDRARGAAVTAYTDGRGAASADALLRSDSSELTIRRLYLDAVVARDRRAIDAYRAAANDAKELEAQLEATERNARLSGQLVQQRQSELEDATAQQQATLATVQGNVAQLIAQEDAAREAAEALKAQELLAQTQAREATRKASLEKSLSASLAHSRSASLVQSRSQSRQATTESTAKPTSSRSTSESKPATTSVSRATTAASSVRATTASTTTTSTASTLIPTAAAAQAGAVPEPTAGSSAQGLAAVEEAKRHLGKPYQWGGEGPDSFDCSGLAMVAWRAAGVGLSHSTTMQWRETTHIDPSDLRAGDLVFFGSTLHHMGIYVGDGMMIEAPSSGKVVRYRSIGRTDFAGATRPG